MLAILLTTLGLSLGSKFFLDRLIADDGLFWP
jgi:hypothetical protein